MTAQKSVTRVFHEIEYTIRINVDENGINIEAETSYAMWRSNFPHSFIEEISRRAGNVKSFPVFLKMLTSALDGDSAAVHLDLLTAQDLDMLRQRQDLRPNGNGIDASSKRYLIMTYQSEFDKVHYPLALHAVEMETVESLRETVQNLQKQLECETQGREFEQLQQENRELRAALHEAQLAVTDRGRGTERREGAELMHVKQSLTKYQNELKALRDTKQRLITDHRKETEQLRKEVTRWKNDVRRLETQLKRGDMSTRGASPSNRSLRGASPSNRSFRGASPSNRSVQSRPRSPSVCSVSSSGSNRLSFSRSNRTVTATSWNTRERSIPRRDLPPRPSPSLSSDRRSQRERPLSASRSRNSSPARERERPLSASRRHDSPARRSNASVSSRSPSPSTRAYVSPYSQPCRPPQETRRPLAPRNVEEKTSPRKESRGVVSDIDARLSALQSFLRNNQTLVES